MRFLELKIPPPLVTLCFAFLMWLVSSASTPFAVPYPLRLSVALVLVFVGVSAGLAGVVSFRRAKTTVNPLKPAAASSLVNSGIYRMTRNPMYLGMLLQLLGWAVYLSNAVAFLFVPLYVLYLNRFQIAPEEQALFALFGADFTAYKDKVRRWI